MPSAVSGGVAEGFNAIMQALNDRKKEQARLEAEAQARSDREWANTIKNIGQSYANFADQKKVREERQKEREQDRQWSIDDRKELLEAQKEKELEVLSARQYAKMGYDPKDQPEIDKIDRQIHELDNSMIVNPEYAGKAKQELLAKKDAFRRIPQRTTADIVNENMVFHEPSGTWMYTNAQGNLAPVPSKKEEKKEKQVIDPQKKTMESLYWKRYFANLDSADPETGKKIVTSPEQAHMITAKEIGYIPDSIKEQFKANAPQATTQPATTQPMAAQAAFQGPQELPNFDAKRQELQQKAALAQRVIMEYNQATDQYDPQTMNKATQMLQQVQSEAQQIETEELSYYAKTVPQQLPAEIRQQVESKRDQLLDVIQKTQNAKSAEDVKMHLQARNELAQLMQELRKIGRGQ